MFASVRDTTMLHVWQAASSPGADTPEEPRFSLLDGRYHGSEQAEGVQGAAEGGSALALRGMAALAVQRGEPPCPASKDGHW